MRKYDLETELGFKLAEVGRPREIDPEALAAKIRAIALSLPEGKRNAANIAAASEGELKTQQIRDFIRDNKDNGFDHAALAMDPSKPGRPFKSSRSEARNNPKSGFQSKVWTARKRILLSPWTYLWYRWLRSSFKNPNAEHLEKVISNIRQNKGAQITCVCNAGRNRSLSLALLLKARLRDKQNMIFQAAGMERGHRTKTLRELNPDLPEALAPYGVTNEVTEGFTSNQFSLNEVHHSDLIIAMDWEIKDQIERRIRRDIRKGNCDPDALKKVVLISDLDPELRKKYPAGIPDPSVTGMPLQELAVILGKIAADFSREVARDEGDSTVRSEARVADTEGPALWPRASRPVRDGALAAAMIAISTLLFLAHPEWGFVINNTLGQLVAHLASSFLDKKFNLQRYFRAAVFGGLWALVVPLYCNWILTLGIAPVAGAQVDLFIFAQMGVLAGFTALGEIFLPVKAGEGVLSRFWRSFRFQTQNVIYSQKGFFIKQITYWTAISGLFYASLIPFSVFSQVIVIAAMLFSLPQALESVLTDRSDAEAPRTHGKLASFLLEQWPWAPSVLVLMLGFFDVIPLSQALFLGASTVVSRFVAIGLVTAKDRFLHRSEMRADEMAGAPSPKEIEVRIRGNARRSIQLPPALDFKAGDLVTLFAPLKTQNEKPVLWIFPGDAVKTELVALGEEIGKETNRRIENNGCHTADLMPPDRFREILERRIKDHVRQPLEFLTAQTLLLHDAPERLKIKSRHCSLLRHFRHRIRKKGILKS